jgi:hypothetical protein
VSRWRLRGTRQQPVCVFNRVLVLKWDAAGDLNDGPKRHSGGCDGVILGSKRPGMTMFAVAGFARTHLKHPGSPARVARREKKLTKSYPVHVAGWSGNAVTRGAR